MEQTALYLRSSKDRSDVSIDAQRRELLSLAKARDLLVIEEFADAVESGKDDQRPGFQALIRALKDKNRAWGTILMLDTSRLARNQFVAHFFRHECKKRGVEVIFAKTPELDGVAGIIMPAVLHAMDEVHSFLSREKGLSGMAENVRQGFRAGGRAPLGYRLEQLATGAIRDGAPVTKTRLAIAPEAPKVAAYLKARAAGISRAVAARQAALELAATTLIGMEWNALTYAGHTVWNVHNERIPGQGYKGGSKRRPREEWVIQYDTHAQLISTEEAEAILKPLDEGRPKRRRHSADYLLSGILKTPAGDAWHGSGDNCYRVGKGRRVARASLERDIIAQILRDFRSDEFVDLLVKRSRQMSVATSPDTLRTLRERVHTLTAQIGKLADLAAQVESPRPFLDKINQAERERAATVSELERLEAETKAADVLRAIPPAAVREILAGLADELETLDREPLKDFIGAMVERIDLCADTLRCQIHYRIDTGDKLASPRGFEPRLPP